MLSSLLVFCSDPERNPVKACGHFRRSSLTIKMCLVLAVGWRKGKSQEHKSFDSWWWWLLIVGKNNLICLENSDKSGAKRGIGRWWSCWSLLLVVVTITIPLLRSFTSTSWQPLLALSFIGCCAHWGRFSDQLSFLFIIWLYPQDDQ